MKSRLWRAIRSAMLLAVVAGCRSPILATPATVTLAPAQSVTVADLRITFVGVNGDSRCPSDAICFWAGDATVLVRVDGKEYELHTGDPSRASVQHGVFRITLAQLQPYPSSSSPILPADYRATLNVDRSAG